MAAGLASFAAGLRFRLGLAAAGAVNSAVTSLLTVRLCRVPERTKVRNKLLADLFIAVFSCCDKVYLKPAPACVRQRA
ncbi:hypothetical protein GTP91_31775 [Rugamonas sp. FT82W]|uniref:Uncharacterized protein n=1 Tax=Duganella vulcania TaxID=2692166 RepID=A0A845GBS7_9BURK|nr:hypothetical protein [Duganella vulcania]